MNMGAIDISYISLLIGFLLIIIPILISYWLKAGIIKSTSIAAVRMGIQLVLIGIFLKYLFDLNNTLVNILWLFVMITVASFAMIKSSDLKINKFLIPTFISLSITTVITVLFFNYVIIGIDNIFEARYLIAIGGMLLGNSLKGNIIGVTNFYKNIKRNENRYHYQLSLGATHFEALLPFIRESYKDALNPFIASMSTYGIVALPGMMTGQLLAGSDPRLAIKYQITIVTAVFFVTSVSTLLTILLTIRNSFSKYGVLNKGIFK